MKRVSIRIVLFIFIPVCAFIAWIFSPTTVKIPMSGGHLMNTICYSVGCKVDIHDSRGEQILQDCKIISRRLELIEQPDPSYIEVRVSWYQRLGLLNRLDSISVSGQPINFVVDDSYFEEIDENGVANEIETDDPFGSLSDDPFGSSGDDPFGSIGDDPFGQN